MDRYSAKSEDPVSKRVTDIGVTIAPEARERIEQLADDPEVMIQRCVWRFIWTKHQAKEVRGSSVEFTIGAEEISKLHADLRQIDSAETKIRHRKRS